METVGQKVAALLAEGAAEGIGGQIAVTAGRRIAAVVRKLVSRGPEADDLGLDRLTGSDPEAIAALARAIDDRVADDPELGAALVRALDAMGTYRGQFVTVIGGGTVGSVINVVRYKARS